ncbi:MAG: nucleotidyltransferase family protein [Oscillospiraceae bacterium]|nr:nucleotidyltransferase family protein [Oscillospiraceae bacterium]
MHTVGAICEYNPFHTGHARQLAEIRRRFGADAAVVCAMSGNFVQRGDFAVVRKQARAEAAILGGADLVLELPLPWATDSAEGFARGGVGVLNATGVVDTLAFGSECADTERLARAADALLSDEFSASLKKELAKGCSFAAARRRAAQTLLGADAACLDEPNDILGVEYCKALRTLKSRIEPLALRRAGAAHDGDRAADGYASASHIRRLLIAGGDAKAFLTPDMARLIEAERTAGRAPVHIANAERAILARLRVATEDELAAFDGGGEGLYHRLYDAARAATGVEQLLGAAKTKRYAHARLRRLLLAAYLGVTPEMRRGTPPYIRVLAMNDRGISLLHDMRGSAALPLLVKPARAGELGEAARRLMELEARATDLYALAYPALSQSAGGGEWRSSPAVINGGG